MRNLDMNRLESRLESQKNHIIYRNLRYTLIENTNRVNAHIP